MNAIAFTCLHRWHQARLYGQKLRKDCHATCWHRQHQTMHQADQTKPKEELLSLPVCTDERPTSCSLEQMALASSRECPAAECWHELWCRGSLSHHISSQNCPGIPAALRWALRLAPRKLRRQRQTFTVCIVDYTHMSCDGCHTCPSCDSHWKLHSH